MHSPILILLLFTAISFASTQHFNLTILLLLDGGTETLPYQLGCLDKLTYSKYATHIWISGDGGEALLQWIDGARNEYKHIEQYIGSDTVESGSTEDRLEDSLQRGCTAAIKAKSRYVLVLNSNVFIHHASLAQHLIGILNNEREAGVISPLLDVVPQTDSNNIYCSADFKCEPIIKREKTGIFVVPKISKIWFMDLEHSVVHKLVRQYVHGSKTKTGMINNLKLVGMKLHTTNRKRYGFMLSSNHTYASRQDVITRLAFHHKIHVSEHILPERSNLGKYIDMTYVINLKRRPEKLANMRNVIYRLGITNVNYTFAIDGLDLTKQKLDDLGYKVLEAYKNPFRGGGMKIGEIGCLFSHYNIWLDAQQRNYGRILVFEDDASILHEKFHDIWADIQTDINSLSKSQGVQTPWELLYLGRRVSEDTIDKETDYDHLVRPGMSFWNVAYALSRRGITKLIDSEPIQNAIPADDLLAVMYDRYSQQEVMDKFPKRNLAALAVVPRLVAPKHYPGDGEYVSDTERSEFVEKRDIVHEEL